MTTKRNPFNYFKYLLIIVPLLLFTSCDSQEDIIFLNTTENLMTKDSGISELFIKVATMNTTNQQYKNSGDSLPDCTGFQFPITFDAYYKDKRKPEKILVQNDEELLQFFSTTLTAENSYYVNFPVTLLDSAGEKTKIYSLDELENTLHTSLNVCDELEDNDSENNRYEYCGKNKKKVTICHKGKEICVSVNAIWGHKENHKEDYLGKCK